MTYGFAEMQLRRVCGETTGPDRSSEAVVSPHLKRLE